MTTEYTENFRFNLPDFRMGPWHDLVNEDFVRIDQLLMSVYGGVDTRPWANNTYFEVGMTCIDTTDNTFWVCSVSHTSAGAPVTFAEDRAAHPSYWARVVVGVAPRGEWENDTLYLPNDMATDSTEGIIGICKDQHTSSSYPLTMRDDGAHWSFLTDFGTSSVTALDVSYDNTTSGSSGDNVQAALDEAFAEISDVEDTVSDILVDVTDLTSRVAANEITLVSHGTRIFDLEEAVSDIQIDIAALENEVVRAIDVTYAPHSTEPFVNVQAGIQYLFDNLGTSTGGGTSVTIAQTPPSVSMDAGSLWWESDTGNLYILYDDGNSKQWVSATVTPSAVSLNAVTYVPQTLTEDQKLQTLSNLGPPTLTGKLIWVSSTAIKFSPFNGDLIKINGIIYRIPSAGVAGMTNTGVYVNGVAAQNLAASTLYYVYAFSNSGVVTADFSTTVHAVSSTAGNVGTEAKSGDNTRTLIGMIRTNGTAQFVDHPTQRFVRSWLNETGVAGANWFTANKTITNVTPVEIDNGFRCELLTWATERVIANLSSTMGNNASAGRNMLAAGIDGVIQAIGTMAIVTSVNDITCGTAQASIASAVEGYHYLSIMGSVNSGTGTWYGDVDGRRTGINFHTTR